MGLIGFGVLGQATVCGSVIKSVGLPGFTVQDSEFLM